MCTESIYSILYACALNETSDGTSIIQIEFKGALSQYSIQQERRPQFVIKTMLCLVTLDYIYACVHQFMEFLVDHTSALVR